MHILTVWLRYLNKHKTFPYKHFMFDVSFLWQLYDIAYRFKPSLVRMYNTSPYAYSISSDLDLYIIKLS